jgi:site-specific DNA recombinase
LTRNVVIYTRVSTQKQADDGVSLDMQAERLRAYASLYNLKIVAEFVDDGYSGKDLDRPGLRAALATDHDLIVYKLDRLTRSVRDLGQLVEEHFRDRALISLSEQIDTRSATGRMILNIIATVAQWEREQLVERVTAAKAYQKTRGEYLGGQPPFGWKNSDGMLVPDPDEQSKIKRMKQLRFIGWTYARIGKEIHGRKGPMGAKEVMRCITAKDAG